MSYLLSKEIVVVVVVVVVVVFLEMCIVLIYAFVRSMLILEKRCCNVYIDPILVSDS